jgi:NAD(P)-dependent dehydrogenase (short-subunit alcohol dehydrogenase family)
MTKRKSVVVTGASTGIGWGCVKVLTAAGFHVFGSVRKPADAERLTNEFGTSVTPLLFDITDEAAVAEAARKVEAALGNDTLLGLVNNAGIAVPGPLLYLKIDDFRRQIAINLTGQLIVTQAFAPLLGADRARQGTPGRIVMISSVGGRNALPLSGPYAASKFGLEGLSESLRRELMLFGIDVIVVAPGAVATPIWDKAEEFDITPFAATPYAAAIKAMRSFMIALGRKGLPPEKIGEVVRTALTSAKPKVRYTVAPNSMQQLMTSILPKRTVDTLIARRLGLVPPK